MTIQQEKEASTLISMTVKHQNRPTRKCYVTMSTNNCTSRLFQMAHILSHGQESGSSGRRDTSTRAATQQSETWTRSVFVLFFFEISSRYVSPAFCSAPAITSQPLVQEVFQVNVRFPVKSREVPTKQKVLASGSRPRSWSVLEKSTAGPACEASIHRMSGFRDKPT